MATETPSSKSLSFLRDPVGQSSGLVGLPNASLGAGLAAKYSGPNLGPSPPNHVGALSPGVGRGLGSLGAEQVEASGVEGQEEALGPGTFVEPLSAAAQCFLGLSTQNPPQWAEKLWKGSFSPKEKTGTREALGAQGMPDSGPLGVGLLPSSTAPEILPGHPCVSPQCFIANLTNPF